jgi:hypothetical protein
MLTEGAIDISTNVLELVDLIELVLRRDIEIAVVRRPVGQANSPTSGRVKFPHPLGT